MRSGVGGKLMLDGKLNLASVSGLALLAALASQSHAQTVTLPVPQVRPHVDQWGVDLTSGAVGASEADLSIGAKGTVGLAHTRTWASAYGWRHGYMMAVHFDSSTHATLEIGGTSYGFTLTGGTFWVNGTFSSDQGDGANLTGNSNGTAWTYVGHDGTQIIFSAPTTGASTVSYGGAAVAVATSITAPTGHTTTLTYKTGSYQARVMGTLQNFYVTRLQSVAISTGYMLKYTYANNTLSSTSANDWARITQVMAINNAVDYCDPTADSCTQLTQSWPTVNYAASTNATTLITTEQVTDPAGRMRTNTWDGSGRLTSIQRATTSIGYTYDGNNNVYYVNAAGVGYWTYSFSTAGGQLTAKANRPLIGPRTVVSSTTTHQVLSDTDENGWTTSYAQDGYGRITKVTAPVGDAVGYTYDGRGNVTQTTAYGAPSAGGGSFTAFSATYPTSCSAATTCNNPTTTADGNGNTTNYFYNNDGTPQYTQQPAVGGIRPEVHYSYSYVSSWLKNSSGGHTVTGGMSQLETVATCRTQAWPCTTSDEVVITNMWNGSASGTNLELIGVITAAGDNSLSSTVRYYYDSVGNMTASVAPNGAETDMTYNADRQPVYVYNPPFDGSSSTPRKTTYTQYQGDGLVSSVAVGTVSGNLTGFTAAITQAVGYDAGDRKAYVETFDSNGTAQALTQYNYSPWNRPMCTAVRMNPAAFSTALNACSLGTQGSNGPDRITFDVWEYGGLPSWEYHGYGTGLQQETVFYTHTSDGQVSTITDANGNVTVYIYDAFQRLIRTCYNSNLTACQSSPSNYDAYNWDNAGNKTGHTTRAGQAFKLDYDALNRLYVKEAPAGVRGVIYSYDLLGHLTSANFDAPGGPDHVASTYDALGRMTSATISMSGTTRTLGYQYDALNDVTQLTYPDGPYYTYGYDRLGGMTNASWTTSGGTVPFYYNVYDTLDRRTITYQGSTNTSPTYDALSRLSNLNQSFVGGTGNVNKAFGYNPASEISSETRDNTAYSFNAYATINRSYTANGLNQYTAAGSASFTYDGNGNLIGDGTNSYTYDAENKLVSATVGGQVVSLTYDPLGRLYQLVGPISGTVQFLEAGQHTVAEYNGAGTLLRRFAWGSGEDEPIMQDEGGALNCTGTRFLAQDDLGSVIAEANCNGTWLSTNTYDEYGIPGSGNWGRYQYTGQAWIPDLGMSYYKARFYSPTLGRFLQTDPTGYQDGLNWYAYTHNNPINGTDTGGTTSPCWGCQYVSGGPAPGELDFGPGEDDGSGSFADSQLANRQFWDNYYQQPGHVNVRADISLHGGTGGSAGSSDTVSISPSNNSYAAGGPVTPQCDGCFDVAAGYGNLRLPDMVSVSGSVPIPNPVTLIFAGLGPTVTFDRYGNVYISINIVGGVPSAAGASVTGGWKIGGMPSPSQLGNLISGPGLGATVGNFVGGGVFGNNAGTAFHLGFVSPGASVNGSYTWKLSRHGFRW